MPMKSRPRNWPPYSKATLRNLTSAMTSLPQGLSYKHDQHAKKRGCCPFFNVYFYRSRFEETTAGERGLALSFAFNPLPLPL